MKTTILAFLQNQWFKDPEGIKAIMAENPERRNRYIQAYLFMGCVTGQRLKQALGEKLCNDIIWEEASPKIAGRSSGAFPADVDHITSAIIKFKPQIVLAFGQIAIQGVEAAVATQLEHYPEPIDFRFITGPHPAARMNVMGRLNEIGDLLKGLSGSEIHMQQYLERRD